MRNILKGLAVLAALSAFYVSPAQAATYTDWNTANRIIVGSGRSDIFLDASLPNPAGCSFTDRAGIPATAANYDSMVAAAMTAISGQFEVRLQISETACADTRPVVLFVSFRN